MPNIPPNDGQDNQPGPYSPNYAPNQPGTFNSQYGAPAPGKLQSLDPRTQEMQEFINYKFSQEELSVIKKCEVDSLVKRSLPIGFGLGFGTFWGCQKGVLKTGKYGAWPKIIGASVLGYIIGRFSYMKTCQEKIMELPNSRLAQMLRNRSRKYNPTLAEESYATDAGFATALTLAPLQTEDYSQSLNLDTNRPDDAGDQYEPTQQGINDLNEDLNIPTRKNFVSYDELRQKNRDDFNKSHRFAPGPSYIRPPAPAAAPSPVADDIGAPSNVPMQPVTVVRDPAELQPNPFAENDRRRANLRTSPVYGSKNQYGDIWTE